MARPLLLHRAGDFRQALRHRKRNFDHLLCLGAILQDQRNKKTDVEEHPQVFRHVGLLFNKRPGAARLPFI